ncbi:MAG: 5-formyltetrahydrofolate cyclo-ligase [Betaproteobacteria bacterium]|nr:5-formyltetrahydrofolate cyclo-ligase [Betaproteobacteria bacterium]
MTAISAVCSNSPVAEKRFWRQQVLSARRRMTKSRRRAGGAALCQKIIEFPAFAAAQCVAAFAPMETEPDIWPVIEHCWKSGKTVALPRVREARQLTFHAVSSRQGLEKNAWGIFEPPQNFPEIGAHVFDFVIVPAVAADSRRRRLGYGGGFYDTFVAKLTHATTCAPIFDCQLIAQTPAEPHDAQIDFVFLDGVSG